MRSWMRPIAVSFALAATCGGTPSATAQVQLRWKFNVGDRFTVRANEERKIKGTENGQVTLGSRQSISEYTFRTLALEADGSARIEATIDRLRLKANSPMGELDYDSGSPDVRVGTAAQVEATVGRLVGAVFTFTRSPLDVVGDFAPTEATRQKFADAPAQLRALIDPQNFQTMVVADTLPEKELKPGDTWSDERELPGSPLGTRTVSTTYTYVGPDESSGRRLEKITLAQTTRFVPKADPRVTLEMKDAKGTGTLLFDATADAGHLVSRVINDEFTLVIKAQGRTSEQESTSTATTEIQRAESAAKPSDPP